MPRLGLTSIGRAGAKEALEAVPGEAVDTVSTGCTASRDPDDEGRVQWITGRSVTTARVDISSACRVAALIERANRR